MAEFWEGLATLDAPAQSQEQPSQEWWTGLGTVDERHPQAQPQANTNDWWSGLGTLDAATQAPAPSQVPQQSAAPIDNGGMPLGFSPSTLTNEDRAAADVVGPVQNTAEWFLNPTGQGGEYAGRTGLINTVTKPAQIVGDAAINNLPVRTVEQTGANVFEHGSNIILTALGETLKGESNSLLATGAKDVYNWATGSDVNPVASAGQGVLNVRDAIHQGMQDYAAKQEELDKQGLLGQSATGVLRKVGGILGEMALLPHVKAEEGAGALSSLMQRAAPLVSYMTAQGAANSLTESDARGETGVTKYAGAAAAGTIDGAFALAMVGAGSGLGKIASGETQGLVQRATEYLTKRYSLSAPLAKLTAMTGESGSQVGFTVATNLSHYLTEVGLGREKYDPDRLLKVLGNGLPEAALAGAVGGLLLPIRDAVALRMRDVPAVKKGINDALAAPPEVKQKVRESRNPTSRREFGNLTGNGKSSQAEREAYVEIVANELSDPNNPVQSRDRPRTEGDLEVDKILSGLDEYAVRQGGAAPERPFNPRPGNEPPPEPTSVVEQPRTPVVEESAPPTEAVVAPPTNGRVVEPVAEQQVAPREPVAVSDEQQQRLNQDFGQYSTTQGEPADVLEPEIPHDQRRDVNRQLGTLKRKATRGDVPKNTVDALAAMPVRDQQAVLQSAQQAADEKNQFLNQVIEEYRAWIDPKTASKARGIEKAGGDEANLRGHDETFQELQDTAPNLVAYAQDSNGLFNVMRDGIKGLEDQLHTADDYLDEAIAGQRANRQQPLFADAGSVGAATPGEIEGKTGTSLKNAVADWERQTHGLEQTTPTERRSMDEAWQHAQDVSSVDPTAGPRLAQSLIANPERGMTDADSALLLKHKTDLLNARNDAARRTHTETTQEGKAAAESEATALTEQLSHLLDAIKARGSEWGREGRWRQAMAFADYSMESMQSRARAARGGRELTPDEHVEVKALHEKISELEAKLARRMHKKNKELQEVQAVEQKERVVKATRKLDRERRDQNRAGYANLMPEEIMADLTKESSPSEISEAAKDLFKHFLSKGMTDRDAILTSVHATLRKTFPDLTTFEVADAVTDYGKFTRLNPDPIEKAFRQRRAELLQIRKLAAMGDLEKLKATGQEREAPTDEHRRLTKFVNEMKKLYNIGGKDDASQLKSALDAMKTRRRNRIKDLEQEIADRRKMVRDKKTTPEDTESLALQKEVDRLKAEHLEIFGRSELTDAQRLKTAQAAAERDLAEFDRRVAERDFSKKPRRDPLDDANLYATRLQRDAAKATLESLRAVDPASKAAADAKANKQLQARITDEYARLAEKYGRGDLTPSKNPESKVVRDAETERLQAKLDALHKQFEQSIWETQRRRTLAEQKADLDAQLKSGNYKAPPEKAERGKPRDITELENQIRDRRNIVKDAIREAQQSKGEQAIGLWLKIRRAFVLSSPMVVGKLSAAASARVAIAPIREAVGGVISKAFPRLAERAPREGGFSRKAEAKAITEMFTKSMQDSWDTLRTGKSDIDKAVGKIGLPPEALGFLGQLHGALKTPAKRNEFARSLQKRTEAAIKVGQNPTDTAVQMGLLADAYKDANRSIFLNDNRVVDAYKTMLATLETPDRETGKVGVGRRTLAVGVRTMLPIVSVPTNIIAETMNHATGLVTGSVEMGLAYKRGIENLKPAEADSIMRKLKDGSLGAATLALGFLAADNIGGYYQPNQKRKKGDVDVGGLRVFGWDVPRWAIHNPLLEVLQIGATMRRVAESKLHKKDRDPQGAAAGALAAAFGLIEEVPFVRESVDAGKLLDPSQRDGMLPREVGDLVVPQAVSWAAKHFDTDQNGETVRRKPTNIWEGVKEHVPGLRETVPKAKPKR